MMEFPLLSLNPTNLEQIINKLEEKSYFRLQQTCKDVYELIHNSLHISVNVDKKSLHPKWNECKRSLTFSGIENIDALYGTRVSLIVPSVYSSTKASVAQIWDVLKENRITSRKLYLPEVNWTVEECVELINAVNPVEIDFYSVGSNQFQAPLQSKTVKKVQLHLGHRDIAAALPQLLPRLRELEIFDETSSTDSLDLPRTFLRCLFSGSFPNLIEFSLQTPWGDGLPQVKWDDASPSAEEMQRALGYELTLVTHHYCYLVFLMKPPAHFPPRAACRLRFVRSEYAVFEYYFTAFMEE